MKNIFSDNSKKGKKVREENILTLENAGYEEAGCYSTSGDMHYIKNRKGVKAVFGCRSNVGGRKATKYFSLVKYYDSVKTMREELRKLNLKKEI